MPLFNEAVNVDQLMPRLWMVLDRIDGPSEVVAVDDGSTDDTLGRLRIQRASDSRLRIISFSRNFGKEKALAAGLGRARGSAIVLMDGDLQHPPELIETFVSHWRAGWLMVCGCRRDRRSETILRRASAHVYYALFKRLCTTELPTNAGDFRLLDRRVVDVINSMPERTRFTKGLYAWVGFKRLDLPFEALERPGGRSGWNFGTLWRFGVDGIVSFSTLPLRLWTYAGLVISLLALGLVLYEVLQALVYGISVPGYPTLVVAIMFFGGVQLIGLGILGEYIGRIFTEVKRRPLYVVAEELGFDDEARRTTPCSQTAPPSKSSPRGLTDDIPAAG